MSQLNLTGVASAYKRNFAAVPVSFNPTRRLPACARQVRAGPHLPARPCRLRPDREANSLTTPVFKATAKKVLIPCVAAVVVGKTTSYLVESFAFIWFMLR